jgi:hypothetical protein
MTTIESTSVDSDAAGAQPEALPSELFSPIADWLVYSGSIYDWHDSAPWANCLWQLLSARPTLQLRELHCDVIRSSYVGMDGERVWELPGPLESIFMLFGGEKPETRSLLRSIARLPRIDSSSVGS